MDSLGIVPGYQVEAEIVPGILAVAALLLRAVPRCRGFCRTRSSGRLHLAMGEEPIVSSLTGSQYDLSMFRYLD